MCELVDGPWKTATRRLKVFKKVRYDGEGYVSLYTPEKRSHIRGRRGAHITKGTEKTYRIGETTDGGRYGVFCYGALMPVLSGAVQAKKIVPVKDLDTEPRMGEEVYCMLLCYIPRGTKYKSSQPLQPFAPRKKAG